MQNHLFTGLMVYPYSVDRHCDMIISGTFIWFPLNLAQDIAHDHDIESEDWHIAIEALCEVICENIYYAYIFFLDFRIFVHFLPVSFDKFTCSFTCL